MIVYRIDRLKRKDQVLSGGGAKLYGGRWNAKGIAALYTASSRSLAILEMLVHFDKKEQLPQDRILVEIELPDKLTIKSVHENNLPEHWKISPAPRVLTTFYTQMVDDKKHIALAVPSVIVPQEYNYVINPNHPDCSKVKVRKWELLHLDERFT